MTQDKKKKENQEAATQDQSVESYEGDLIQIRREKRDEIRATGRTAYPNDFRPKNSARQVIDECGALSKEELEEHPRTYALAGRIMSKRDFGKAAFAHITDDGNRIQVFFQKDRLGEVFADTKKLDIGDIIAVEGEAFRTKTDELTISVGSVRLLVKGLRPLPEKWHGLTDVETRYRRRYVDLMVNPDVRSVFETRSRVITAVRTFFTERGFIEVETPMLHQIVGGATARPFITHHNTLDMDLFLRIAPELYLKRLLVGGMNRVFEINKNFRNEGISTQHNPEFTMLEFYQAYAAFEDLMSLTEELFVSVAREVTGRHIVEYQGKTIDFSPPWERITMFDATIRYGGIDEAILTDEKKMRAKLSALGVEPDPKWGWGKLLVELFEKSAEDNLLGPVFITRFPTEVSPLSRLSDDDPSFVDRFELYLSAMEVANGFSELNDPEDQEARFLKQLEDGDFGEGVREYDRDYIRALEYGMPPAAGEGIGIDRMIMLLTDSPSIRDVILFPQLREKDSE
ncbi:MAG: lysine--tRNA ligase [Deltaproteobacteria bacterium]|nr:lysine--tRNA ligase [Candidatus Zymogenaceae bacterium]